MFKDSPQPLRERVPLLNLMKISGAVLEYFDHKLRHTEDTLYIR